MREFKSVGAAMTDAVTRFLTERELLRRQQLIESITISRDANERAERQRAANRKHVEQQQSDADRLAGIHGPNDDINPDIANTLRGGGYQVAGRNTLAARTMAAPTAVPGVVSNSPIVAPQDLASLPYARRNETHTERLAREQREAASRERDEDRQFRWDSAREGCPP